jgi:hypothetical protein
VQPIEGEGAMAQVTVVDGFALLIAFDGNGDIIEVQYPDGDRYHQPLGSFDTSPLYNITLHRVEELSIMIYEKSDGTRIMCPHKRCDRWCDKEIK